MKNSISIQLYNERDVPRFSLSLLSIVGARTFPPTSQTGPISFAMPGLVLFGRRWMIGPDDFVIPAVVCSCLHGIWYVLFQTSWHLKHTRFHFRSIAIFGTVIASAISPQTTDTGQWLYRSLFGLNLTFGLCQLVNSASDFLVAKVSAAGSILDNSDRRWLPTLLYARCGKCVSCHSPRKGPRCFRISLFLFVKLIEQTRTRPLCLFRFRRS